MYRFSSIAKSFNKDKTSSIMKKLEDPEIKRIIKILEEGMRTQEEIADLKNISQARINL